METKTPSIINGFTLVNEEKLNRTIEGSMSREGQLNGGVGKDADGAAILAEYDRLGGLIRKGKYIVKTGSFYDFPNRKPREKPEVTLVFRDINDNVVEIPENDPIPLEVKAAEAAKAGKVSKAKAPKAAKKVVADDDEE